MWLENGRMQHFSVICNTYILFKAASEFVRQRLKNRPFLACWFSQFSMSLFFAHFAQYFLSGNIITNFLHSAHCLRLITTRSRGVAGGRDSIPVTILDVRSYIYGRAHSIQNMVKVKSITDTVANWKGSHSRIPAAYEKGIQGTTGWLAAATSDQARTRYKQNVDAAYDAGLREKALQKGGEARWKDKAVKKGASNISTGLRESIEDYQSAMGKVTAVIAGVPEGAKGATGIESWMNRGAPIVKALEDAKKRGDFL